MIGMCQLVRIVLKKWPAFVNKSAQLHGRGARDIPQIYKCMGKQQTSHNMGKQIDM